MQITISLLIKSEPSLASKFVLMSDHFLICEMQLSEYKRKMTMSDLINKIIMMLPKSTKIEDKCLIVKMSKKVTIDISSTEQVKINGTPYVVIYKSHIEQSESMLQVFFRFDNQIYFQVNDSIYSTPFGSHMDVTLIAVVVSRCKSSIIFEDFKFYIYDSKDQLKLRKIRLKNLNPDKFLEIQENNREYDRTEIKQVRGN